MRQLIGFLLPKTVPSICDENHRNDELAVRVHQLVKSFLGPWDGRLSPHQNPIDVEQQAETWLVLFKQMKNVRTLFGYLQMIIALAIRSC